MLIGSLVLVLAAAGALGLTAVRGASSGNLGTSGAQTPMTPAVTDAPSSALKVPPPAPSSIGSPPPTEAPAPARAGETNGSSEQKSTERVKAEVVTPRQGQPETPPAAGVTPSTNRAGTPRATVRSEPASTEAGDPTAVIDWLLKTKGQ